MRKLWSLILLFFSIFSSLNAAYLEKIPCKLVQPNGDTLHCYVSGDEFYHFYHDENNYTIIQDIETGYYVYAKKSGKNIVPSEHIAGKVDPRSVLLEPGIRKSTLEINEIRKARYVPMERERLAYRKSRGVIRNHGNMNNIVIFIRFKGDAPLTTSFSTVSQMFNDTLSNANSMYNYFKRVSYEQLFIQSSFYPAPNGNTILSYEDIYNRNYYLPYSVSNPSGYSGDTERKNREFALLARAVNAVKSSIPPNLNIDYNQDGLVDNICFVIKGNVGSWSDLLWPHRWALYDRTVLINGKRVYDFNFQLEGATNYFNNAVLCHEMFHTLGAPDLYHYSNDWGHLSPVGRWDLMEVTANPPQNMGAYMKYHYGNWLDSIPEITRYGNYTLYSLGSHGKSKKCYKIKTENPNQFFVLEYRRISDPFESMVYGSGLVIYRINTNFGGNADYDGATEFDEVYVFRPGGTTTINGTLSQSFFSSNSGRTQFKIGSNPSPFLTNGTAVDIIIEEVSSVGDSLTFRYGPLSGDITVTPAMLAFQGTSYTPAANKSSIVIGNYLTDSITLTLPISSPFRISKDEVNWGKQIQLPTNGGTCYVQLHTQIVGNYSDTILLSSIGVADAKITLRGTICDRISTFPWTEGFEDGTLPSCWSEQFENGSISWSFRSGAYTGSGIATAHSGNFNAYFAHSSFTPYTTKLVTPTFDLSSLANPKLSFWHAQKTWGNDIDKLKVYYRTSETSPWVLLQYYDTNIPNWTEHVLSLPNKNATYSLAFEGINYYGYGVVIDDIMIYDDPPQLLLIDKNFLQFSTPIDSVGQIDSVLITGQYLTQPIQVQVDSPFQLSIDKVTWNTSLQINVNGGMLYIRYVPTLPRDYCETIFFTSDTLSQQVLACGTTLLPNYSIVATSDNNGTISPQGTITIEYGDTLQFQITPNLGYEVDEILVDGTPIDSINSFTFYNITDNHTIDVTFKKIEFIITASCDNNGTISPQGNITVEYGDALQFQITPNIGYEVNEVLIDGNPVDSTNSFMFYNITDNHTIDVTFKKIEFTIIASCDNNGTISPQGNITVEYGDNLQFQITPSIGYEVDEVLVDSNLVDSTNSFTFYNITTNHTIDVTFKKIEFIIIASCDNNGTISPQGNITVEYGDNLQFQITPNIGYEVNEILVDGNSTDSTNSFTFYNITDNHTIAVTFKKIEFIITASCDNNGTISPQGTIAVEYGDNLQFQITPNLGYEVDEVLIDGNPVDSINSFTFYNITSDHSIAVTFKKIEFTITASCDNNGTISPQGNITVEYGDTLQFQITPNIGYEVDEVLIDGSSVDSINSFTFYNITDNHTITVTFKKIKFTIIANCDNNGTISPQGTITVEYGDTTQFLITPNLGYEVDEILVDGNLVDSINSFTFYNITDNHTIAVTYKKIEFTITASCDNNGTISPSGIINVEYGDTLQFQITPNIGYEVDEVLIDGNPVDSTNSFTFYNITDNHSIVVTFKKIEFIITANCDNNGTISPQGNIVVQYGNNLQFQITPNLGYEINEILVDGNPIDSINSYTFYNITSDHSIAVTFKKIEFTIIANCDNNGTISPQGNITVEYGDTTQFLITPNIGYEVDEILVDGSPVDSINSFTFYNITDNHTITVTTKISITQIKEINKIENSIYPNPVSTVLNLVIPDFKEVKQLQFFNVRGQLLFSTSVESQEMILDITHWASGIYFLKIVSQNNNIEYQKIIKK